MTGSGLDAVTMIGVADSERGVDTGIEPLKWPLT